MTKVVWTNGVTAVGGLDSLDGLTYRIVLA